MLFSALILGFLGSLHCVGMCGPIAFVLPLDRNNPIKKTSQIFVYHIGRICTYATLGLLFGLLGKTLYISGLQQRLSILVGLIMILLVLIPYQTLQKYNFSKPVFRFLSSVKSAMGSRLKQKSYKTLFSIGILNGLLPCGLIYMALFGAIAMGSIQYSAFYMVLFGVGTIPLMTGAAFAGNFLTVSARRKVKQLIPLFVVLIGVFFILRGMGLGIPYVSPADTHLIIKPSPDCTVP